MTRIPTATRRQHVEVRASQTGPKLPSLHAPPRHALQRSDPGTTKPRRAWLSPNGMERTAFHRQAKGFPPGPQRPGFHPRAMTAWLIVGLGNPGPSYSGHRHSVGAMVVDELAVRAGASLRSHKARAAAAEVRLSAPGVGTRGGTPLGTPGHRAIIAKPLTFMNESGGPVAGLLSFYKVPTQNLIVIHDELDIPFAEVRLKLGGGEGGHNGLRSITKSVGTRDYLRVRVGIGRPPGRMDPADYVLHDFSSTERSEVPLLISDAADAIERLVAEGLVAAQQEWHSR